MLFLCHLSDHLIICVQNLLYFFLRRKPYPFTVYRIAVSFGLLCILPFAAVQAYVTPVDWIHMPYWVWLVEIYVGVFVTAGAHAMIAWVVRFVHESFHNVLLLAHMKFVHT